MMTLFRTTAKLPEINANARTLKLWVINHIGINSIKFSVGLIMVRLYVLHSAINCINFHQKAVARLTIENKSLSKYLRRPPNVGETSAATPTKRCHVGIGAYGGGDSGDDDDFNGFRNDHSLKLMV
ncbi:hypothetical protein GQX74_013001 [Glossina fuscipes]|nr:hypothetical protein GQX74_013001 [Glossina fuscipes]